MDEKKSSWWTTVPGILTGIAGLITATGGLLLILYEINVIGPKQNEKTIDEKQKTEENSKEEGKEEEIQPEEIESVRAELEKQMTALDDQIKELTELLEQKEPEAEKNPDVIDELKGLQKRLNEIEMDKKKLIERLNELQPVEEETGKKELEIPTKRKTIKEK